jgi:hypothetical protein
MRTADVSAEYLAAKFHLESPSTHDLRGHDPEDVHHVYVKVPSPRERRQATTEQWPPVFSRLYAHADHQTRLVDWRKWPQSDAHTAIFAYLKHAAAETRSHADVLRFNSPSESGEPSGGPNEYVTILADLYVHPDTDSQWRDTRSDTVSSPAEGQALARLTAAAQLFARTVTHTLGADGAADLLHTLNVTSEDTSERDVPELLSDVLDPPLSRQERASLTTALAIRNAQAEQALLVDSASGDVVAATFGISETALEEGRLARQLLAFSWHQRWMFPLWQFDASQPAGVIADLADVLTQLAPLSDREILDWLRSPNAQLGLTRPLDALRSGHSAQVVRAAAAVGAI